MILCFLAISFVWDHFVVTLKNGQRYEVEAIPRVTKSETFFKTLDGRYFRISNRLVLDTRPGRPHKPMARRTVSPNRKSLSQALAEIQPQPRKAPLIITDDHLEAYAEFYRRVVNEAMPLTEFESPKTTELDVLRQRRERQRSERERLQRRLADLERLVKAKVQQRWDLVTRPHELGAEHALDVAIAELQGEIEAVQQRLRETVRPRAKP